MSQPIHQWPSSDRPREKLLAQGEGALTDGELLAILLRTGNRGETALDLARQILSRFKTFRHMTTASMEDWLSIRGLGPAKCTQIKAAIEIGRRFRENETREERPAIRSSKDAVDILMPQMRDGVNETFKTVYLDAKHCIVDIRTSAQGTVNRAVPFVRDIIRDALARHATAIICCHNHPSGDPAPSEQDRVFTREMITAGHVMQVKVLDHIIIGDNRYYSFADAGDIF